MEGGREPRAARQRAPWVPRPGKVEGCGRPRCSLRDPRTEATDRWETKTGSGRSQTGADRWQSSQELSGKPRGRRGRLGLSGAPPPRPPHPESSSSPGYTSSASPSRCLQGRPRKPRTELTGLLLRGWGSSNPNSKVSAVGVRPNQGRGRWSGWPEACQTTKSS